jgi:hypothetical protein
MTENVTETHPLLAAVQCRVTDFPRLSTALVIVKQFPISEPGTADTRNLHHAELISGHAAVEIFIYTGPPPPEKK